MVSLRFLEYLQSICSLRRKKTLKVEMTAAAAASDMRNTGIRSIVLILDFATLSLVFAPVVRGQQQSREEAIALLTSAGILAFCRNELVK